MQYTGSVSYKDIADKNFLTVDNLDSKKISDIINELNNHNIAYSAQYDNAKITVTSEKADGDNIRKIVDSVLMQSVQQKSPEYVAREDNARSDTVLEELRQEILQMQEKMKEKEFSEHNVEPPQQENKITQIQSEHQDFLPVISTKVLKQDQKLDSLNEKKSICTEKIADYHSRAASLTDKVKKLNATNQMLSQLASKKALPPAVKNSILALINNNEKKLAKIRNQKLPKLEEKISNQTKKIESIDKCIDLAQSKINRYESLNNVISSFLHGNTERFSQSLDELHNNSVALLNAKIDVKTDNIMRLTNEYKKNPTLGMAAGIPLELTKLKRQRNNLIRKRNKLIGVIVPYVSQSEKVQTEVFTQVKNVVGDAVKQENITPAEVADIVVEKSIEVIPEHSIITVPPSNDVPLLLPEIAAIMDTSVSELNSKPKDIQELLVLDYTNNFDSSLEEIQESLSSIITPNARVEEHLYEKKEEQAVGSNQQGKEKDNPLKTAEELTEGNANMIDGIINNEPPKKDEPKREPPKKEKPQGFSFSLAQMKQNAKRISQQKSAPPQDKQRKPPDHGAI